VTSADAPFPAGASEADWRDAVDVNANDTPTYASRSIATDICYSRSDFFFPIFQNHGAPI
jgi:hypothetical protein